MRKRLLLFVLALAVALSAFFIVACAEKVPEDETASYSITVEKEGEGEVTVAERAKADEEVTITLSPSSGYYTQTVKVNSEPIEVANNSAKFTMPDEDVVIYVVFAESAYEVNIGELVGGTVTADKASYKSGDTVTLTVTPAYGYELKELKVDGKAATVTNGKHTFTMPANDVAVTAEFDCAVDSKPMPTTGSIIQLNASAPITGGVAKANYFLVFGDDALTVTVYVEDATPVEGVDGVRLFFGTTEYTNNVLSDKNVQINALVRAAGAVYVGSETGYVAATDTTGITAATEPWSKAEGVVCGYIVTVKVDYDCLAVDAESLDQLTFLPYLVNTDRRGSMTTITTVDSFYDYTKPDTYMTISENELHDNRYMFGKGAAGSYKNVVVKGAHWNTERDYEEGSPNYNSRQIKLEGQEGDNDIAFFGSAGKTGFVKATFTVNTMTNENENAPKFGLMAYDTLVRDTGVFYYVDAFMDENKSAPFTVNDISGTKLGYNSKNNAVWTEGWTSIESTSGAYSKLLKTVTIGMLVKNGLVYMYHYPLLGSAKLVGASSVRTTGDTVIGIKAFGIGITVSAYQVTNDPESSLITSLPKRTDGTTIGDSESGYLYTDGWTIDTANDTASNTGSGLQYLYVKGATASTSVYGEVDITSPEKVGTEAWSKAGMMLGNNKYTVFGYIDCADQTSHNEYGRAFFAIRDESKKDWVSWAQGTSLYRNDAIKSGFINLAMAKIGQDFYLLVNGEIAASYSNSVFKDEEFVAGVLSSSRQVTVKNGVGLSGSQAVREKLGIGLPSDIEFDGVLDDDVWSTAVLNNKVTAAGKNGTKIEVVAVKVDGGVAVAVTLYAKKTSTHGSSITYTAVPHVAFRLGKESALDKHYIAFYNGFNGDITSSVNVLGAAASSARGTVDGEEGYITTVEFFIPLRAFGSDVNEDKLPFHIASFRLDGQTNTPEDLYDGKLGFITAEGLIFEDEA